MKSDTKTLIIRFAGDSGDGMQLVGEQLTLTAAQTGCEVRTLPDFPAEIRAPAGTLAGVSAFQVAMSEQAIFTAGEELDVLVAMNPAALKHSISYLKPGGILIINNDNFSDKDWQKSGVSASLLEDAKSQHQVLDLPLITNVTKVGEGLDVTLTESKRAKNFYVLGIVLWLFDLSPKASLAFIANKFKNKPILQQLNHEALKSGTHYAETIELARSGFIAKCHKQPGTYRQITGIGAIGLAMAALTTKTGVSALVSGYPITPASAILHECAGLSEFGIGLFQAEDEIAAICASLGAAFAGKLALTCTSGPGFDLKTEGLGLAVASELPLVVIDVQRAGVSTGMPTKTGQSDLQQALYGRHGEAPLPVLAPKSPVDCFYTLIEAFTLATQYMTPVVILMDAYLANATESWLVPDIDSLAMPEIKYNRNAAPFWRDDKLSRSWNIPGSTGFIHQLGGLEKQGEWGKVSYDGDNHQKMVQLRSQKIQNTAQNFAELEIEGRSDAPSLVVSWGSTYGGVQSAIDKLADELPVAHLHLRHLHPLPNNLKNILQKYPKLVVVELNSGQLCQLIRGKYLVDARPITQCNGQPFSTRFLVQAILAEAKYDSEQL